MKINTFQLLENGTVEKVGPFGSFGPTVKAATKTEATTLFLAFAYRSVENPPTVKVRNSGMAVGQRIPEWHGQRRSRNRGAQSAAVLRWGQDAQRSDG